MLAIQDNAILYGPIEDWCLGYALVCEYVDIHGVMPDKHVIYREVMLGAWVHAQREYQSIGVLPPNRVSALTIIPGWYWDDLAWERYYEDLTSYVYQNLCMPTEGVIWRGNMLGPWVRFQRLCYSAGALESAYITKLEQLPGWYWEDSAWIDNYKIFQLYVNTYDICPVPGVIYRNVRIGDWVHDQCNTPNMSLTPEVLDILEWVKTIRVEV